MNFVKILLTAPRISLLDFMYVQLMSVFGGATVCQLEETKTRRRLNMISSLHTEGVDSSFDMQNGPARNLLTGSHKPV